MKTVSRLIWVICILAGSSTILAMTGDNPAQSDTGSVRLTLSAGHYEIPKDQEGLDRIKMEGFGHYRSPGNPMLPRKVYNIAVPPNVIWSSLELKVVSATTHILDGAYDLKPAGPMVTDAAGGRRNEAWGEGKHIVNGKNLNVYQARSRFPENCVKLLPYSQMRKWKFTRVDFSPVQYDPVSKTLYLTETMEIEICYRLSEDKLDPIVVADTVMDDMAADTIFNYDQARLWYTPEEPADDLVITPPPSNWYQYVIITTNAIKSGSTKLNEFIAHKSRRIGNVLVVTENDFDGLIGQSPNNRAEKIRQWLINNYEAMHIMYVLLIGDPKPFESGGNDIPMKMCYPRYRNEDDHDSPTDAFYADLTGNWDKDGDQYYGEFAHDYDVSGGVDFSPEVYVGRIPVYESDYTSLDNILQKIIDYETERIGDQSWRRSILMPMSFLDNIFWIFGQYDGAALAEQMKDDYLDAAGYACWRMYQQGNGTCGFDSKYTSEEELRGGDEVRDRWGGTDFGIVVWNGHGSSTQAFVGYGDCEDGDMLSCLDASFLDDDHPAFTYQCSCDNGYPETRWNLQYALLKQGAIATVGATRVSWFNTGQGYGEFDDKVSTDAGIGYEYTKNLVANAWYSAAGPALCLAKLAFADDCREYLMNRYDFNLYGDPSISITSRSQLTVYTLGANNIGASSATLNGRLFEMDSAPTAYVSFLWGDTWPLTHETPPQAMTTPGYFSVTLADLNPATTYYFIAQAVGDKTVGSWEGVFTTSPIPPRVTTNWVTDITPNSVTLNGDLTSLGNASSVQVSFEWDTSTLFVNKTTPVTMTTTGPFRATISGLVQGTIYHFRAKAVGQSTVFGDDRIFTPGSILHVPGDFSTIQAALDRANPSQVILVADGTYAGPGNKNLQFKGKNLTLQSENGPKNCIIDCQQNGRGFNFNGGESDKAVVSGFTITNGYCSNEYGGGIYCTNTLSPTIINCKIINNTASFGGGIGCLGRLSITNSTVSGNKASYGGGIGCGESSTITNCTLSGNTASERGGGIYSSQSFTITHCTISGNTASFGGGIDCAKSSIITNSTILKNTASSSGGGINCFDSPTITNCIIAGNTALSGGGIDCSHSTIITNCTLVGNRATGLTGGGIYCYDSPVITNCILWADTPNEIYHGSPLVTYCDVQGGYAGEGNIKTSPIFVNLYGTDPAQWNLHLQCGSPCIDVGYNNAPQMPQEDFEGDPRIFDCDSDGAVTVDMGADEAAFYRPRLSNAGMSPGSGDQHTLFRFTVDYYHPGLYEPIVKSVIINGTAHTMDLLTGSPACGTYYFDTALRPGAQYYFAYNDGINGCTARLPAEGTYTGPFVSNQCPTLDNGGVNPGSGDTTTIFRFTVDYYDPDNIAPAVTKLVIDGTSHTMDLLSGSPSHGTYYYDTTLAPGTKYYYYFDDGAGCTARLPSDGSLIGPFVTSLNRYVPDEFPTIQAALDVCQPGDTIIVRNGRYTGVGNKNLDFNNKVITLRSEHGSANCVIDCEHDGIGLSFHNYEKSTSIVDGLSITNGSGGAIYCESSPTIRNCRIIGNTSSTGSGGINVSFKGPADPVTIINCVFIGNSTGNWGGGVKVGNMPFERWSSATIINCTFSGNSSVRGGGISISSPTASVISNCILWGNSATSGPQLASGGGATVSYSDIQGGQSQVYGSVKWGDGNIDADPMFVDTDGIDGIIGTADDNLRLLPGSPCLDMGDNTLVPSSVVVDLNGNPRFLDGNCDGKAIIDMGAYEYVMGDLNSNDSVDMQDLDIVGTHWAETNCTSQNNWCLGVDLDRSGTVDINDLKIFVQNWLWGSTP
jgi:parallel beta-helix repeat protein